MLHADNHAKVAQEWIKAYGLEPGNFDITDVDKELAEIIPTSLQMGKVYQRLISDTLSTKEDYADGIINVYK